MNVAYILIRNNDSLLLVKRSEKSKFSNMWELPGGKIEENESPEETIIRECYEETKIKLNKENIKLVKVTKLKDINVFIFSTRLSEKKEVILSDEHSDFAWVDINKLKTFDLTKICYEIVKDYKK